MALPSQKRRVKCERVLGLDATGAVGPTRWWGSGRPWLGPIASRRRRANLPDGILHSGVLDTGSSAARIGRTTTVDIPAAPKSHGAEKATKGETTRQGEDVAGQRAVAETHPSVMPKEADDPRLAATERT